MLNHPNRLLIPLRWAALLAILSLCLAPQHPALAHPVDMYAQSQAVTLAPAGLSVDWKITPGPLLADAVWGAADLDHDGAVSPQEAQAWSAPLLSQWAVTLDNRPLAGARILDVHWPSAIDVFRTGEDAIHIDISVSWDAAPGKYLLELHNSFQEANSLNGFSLAGRDGLSFDEPTQDNGRLGFNLYFPQTTAAAPATTLTSWDSSRPHLPGFSDTVSGLAANLANGPQAGAGPATPASALIGLVKTQETSAWFLVGAFLLSLALGSLHALTPGHGKALVAAYLVGSQGRTRDAIFLGSVVTLTHTGSVIVLGLITLLASHFILPSLIVPWLEVISGLLVIAFGVNLFRQRRGDLPAWFAARHQKQAAGPLYRAGTQAKTFSLQTARIAAPLQPGQLQAGSPAALAHTHDGHTHTHALPPTGRVTVRSLVTLGVSGGLVPCPDAIAILLVAVALNRIPFGMLLILAFSIGLAFVLIGIGIAMVQGIRLVGRNELFNRFTLLTPLISAIVVSVLGVGLTLNAVNSFGLAASAAQPNPAALSQTPAGTPLAPMPFDIARARLVYLAPDGRRQNQLSLLSLAGGAPATLTHEASGVAGYAISPDRTSILYTVIKYDGSSSLWGIDTGGAQRRLVLDCPQAECAGPVWYPDGKKLVYERLNNPQGSTVSVFSLWWLDPATGETHPVFQDQAFPSIAPAFSPDGRWLSFISPLNNTIQLYNLAENRTTSITLSRSYQPRIARPWDPSGASLLFWEPASPDANAPLHVKRYDLASGRRTDLGGPADLAQFETTWSPDGSWVAVTRGGSPGSTGAGQRQEIWLVHPDGSQGHSLVAEDQVSYSNLAWSPDGHFLVYSRYSTAQVGRPEIWLAGVSGSQPPRLLTGGVLPALLP